MKDYKNGVNKENLHCYITNTWSLTYSYILYVPIKWNLGIISGGMVEITDIVLSVLYAMLIYPQIKSHNLKGQYFI